MMVKCVTCGEVFDEEDHEQCPVCGEIAPAAVFNSDGVPVAMPSWPLRYLALLVALAILVPYVVWRWLA